MYCKECGYNMGDGHIACPKCGTLVDFEINDHYGIDWDLNGKSKPLPKVEIPSEDSFQSESIKVEVPLEDFVKTNTYQAKVGKPEPIQWEPKQKQQQTKKKKATQKKSRRSKGLDFDDWSDKGKLIFGVIFFAIFIGSILSNEDSTEDTESYLVDQLPSNATTPHSLYTFRGIVFNDCADYQDLTSENDDIDIVTDVNDAEDNCMLLTYGSYRDGKFDSMLYYANTDMDIYDVAESASEATYANDNYIYYRTQGREIYRYNYSSDIRELIDSDVYSWDLSKDDNYIIEFKLDGYENVICSRNQDGEEKELYRGSDYYDVISVSNDGDFAYIRSLEKDYEIYSLENGEITDLGFHCIDTQKFHTSYDGRSMISSDGDNIYYHQAGEETARVIGSGDSYDFVLKDTPDEMICSFLTEDMQLQQLTIKDGEITTIIIGDEELIESYAVSPDNTYYYLTSDYELYRWKDGESTFLDSGVDYTIAYDSTSDGIVYTIDKELYQISNDSTEPILLYDDTLRLYKDTQYPDSKTCGYVTWEDEEYIRVIVQDGYFIIEDV